jgi:uncharacterized membrane protein YphA (DoxX/SURF4 family)
MKKYLSGDRAKILVSVLRVAIGWHFLYEGVSKLFVENWSAYSYLVNTSGFFSGFYHWLALSETLLHAVDILNICGLLCIGLALFTGFLSRAASAAGVLLLTLYYFAYPPVGASLLNMGEGHLFIVDRIFIEGIALLFLFFYKDRGYGMDTFLKSALIRRKKSRPDEQQPETQANSRREVLKNLSTLPLLGLMEWM